MGIVSVYSGGSEVKASACNVGDLGSIPGLARSPGEGNSCPPQYNGLENSTDQSMGSQEADTTERLSLHFHILKVCELQPGGARALDQPACNSLAVSGPSGRHTSVLLRHSYLSHLLLDHPPTSV